MRTLTELSGEYVTFDKKVQKYKFQMTWRIDSYRRSATLFERLRFRPSHFSRYQFYLPIFDVNL